MLIQLPSGSRDQLGSRNAENCDAFEEGLRRDLASAQIVSYDSMLGGWPKRAVDLILSFLSLPLWLPAMLLAAAWAKLRNPRLAVFRSDDRIGYGGRHFNCFALSIAPPSANDEVAAEQGAPANDWSAMANQAENRRAKWRRALERLPRMFNVLSGDMALVGPVPLSREDLEPLKTARRYYLSARPGVIGIDALVEGGDANQFKVYAMSWSLTTDMLLLWDAMRSLRDRGELWKPSIRRRASGEVVVRQRTNA